MPNPHNDFVMTQQEAKKFRRIQKLYGALILAILSVSAYAAPPLAKKVWVGLKYDGYHTKRRIDCTECNMSHMVTKPKDVSLGEMKENGFICPHCEKRHGHLCVWCGNELL